MYNMPLTITKRNLQSACDLLQKIKKAIVDQNSNIENFQMRIFQEHPTQLEGLYEQFKTFNDSYNTFINGVKSQPLWKEGFVSDEDKTTIDMLKNKHDLAMREFSDRVEQLSNLQRTGFSSTHDPHNQVIDAINLARQEHAAEEGRGLKRRKTSRKGKSGRKGKSNKRGKSGRKGKSSKRGKSGRKGKTGRRGKR